MSRFHYFAYGSNLLLARIRQADRCPGAQPVGRALLPGHRLTFDKLSDVDGSGKATVVHTGDPADVVWGLLLTIRVDERPALDKVEGLGKGYDRARVDVVRPRASLGAAPQHAAHADAALFEPLQAFTYRAPDAWRRPGLLPMSWYRELVLAGARESGLPSEWIRELHSVGAIEDSDRERDARERRVLPSS